MTNPVICGTIRYSEKTETTGAHEELGEIPLKVSVIGTKTMKFKTATGHHTVRPVYAKWKKGIAALEKHAAKKKLRHAHKIELKNFDLGAYFT